MPGFLVYAILGNKGDRQRDFLEFVEDKACKHFGTVLGPDADEAHENHLHVDMKQRQSAFCQ